MSSIEAFYLSDASVILYNAITYSPQGLVIQMRMGFSPRPPRLCGEPSLLVQPRHDHAFDQAGQRTEEDLMRHEDAGHGLDGVVDEEGRDKAQHGDHEAEAQALAEPGLLLAALEVDPHPGVGDEGVGQQHPAHVVLAVRIAAVEGRQGLVGAMQVPAVDGEIQQHGDDEQHGEGKPEALGHGNLGWELPNHSWNLNGATTNPAEDSGFYFTKVTA